MKAITIRETFEDILKPKSKKEINEIYKIIQDFIFKVSNDLDKNGEEVGGVDTNFFMGGLSITFEIRNIFDRKEITEILDPYMDNIDVLEFIDDGFVIEIYSENIPYLAENIGGAGGAGYAVYGGGWGRSFGNPSMGGRFGGRGFGFGGSHNLHGGPNLMYTYSVKPLNQDLQPPPTTNNDVEEKIHTGSNIKGTVLNSNKKIKGNIIHIEEDEDNNIKWYVVLDEEGIKQKVDPTTAYLVKVDDFLDPFIEDKAAEESEVQESFYPSLK